MKKYALAFLLIFLVGCSGLGESTPNSALNIIEIPSQYQFCGASKDRFVFVTEKQQIVVFDSLGEICYSLPQVEDVTVTNGILKYEFDGKWKYINCETGEEIPESKFCQTVGKVNLSKELTPCKGSNGLWGYVDNKGMWKISPQFSYADEFTDEIAYVERREGRESGFVNKNGEFSEVCIDGDYKDAFFSEGIMLIQYYIYPNVYSTYITNKNTLLYSELEGERYVGYPYRDAKSFCEGMAAVQIGDKWGYIDSTGNVKVAPTYQEAYSFSDGYAIVKTSDCSFGLIDQEGVICESIESDTYMTIGIYSNGAYGVELKNGEKNIVNSAGEFLLSQNVQNITVLNAKIPVWDLRGSYYIPMCEIRIPGNSIQIFDDVAIIDDCKLYDLKTGKLLNQADVLYSFHEGIALAINRDLWGYLDVTGKWIIRPSLSYATDCVDGTVFVQANNKQGLLNLKAMRDELNGTVSAW